MPRRTWPLIALPREPPPVPAAKLPAPLAPLTHLDRRAHRGHHRHRARLQVDDAVTTHTELRRRPALKIVAGDVAEIACVTDPRSQREVVGHRQLQPGRHVDPFVAALDQEQAGRLPRTDARRPRSRRRTTSARPAAVPQPGSGRRTDSTGCRPASAASFRGPPIRTARSGALRRRCRQHPAAR